MLTRTRNRGMSLVEVLFGITLLSGATMSVMFGMSQVQRHSEYLRHFQVAMDAAQGQLEQLSLQTITTLWTDPAFQPAVVGPGLVVDLEIDLGNQPGNPNNVPILPGGMLIIQIRQPADDQVMNPTDPHLLDLHVAVCWELPAWAGAPWPGEDSNCNGQVDAGEDLDGDNFMDSSVMFSTRIGKVE